MEEHIQAEQPARALSAPAEEPEAAFAAAAAAAEPAPAAATEPAPDKAREPEDFQSLIRGRYREDYLQALSRALQAQADQTGRYMAWLELRHSAEALSRTCPEFDLARQMADPAFARLVRGGVDLATAYEAVQLTKKRQRSAAAERNAVRPPENGLGASAAPVLRPDPAELSADERRSIRRRAARGEKIVW